MPTQNSEKVNITPTKFCCPNPINLTHASLQFPWGVSWEG